MTLAPLTVIGSTPDDTLLAALDSLLPSPIPARSPKAALECLAWRSRALQWAAENRWCEFSRDRSPSLAGLERILGPILAAWRHTRATGHSAGRSSDDYTLDALPEEMADGDPQMAECLW